MQHCNFRLIKKTSENDYQIDYSDIYQTDYIDCKLSKYNNQYITQDKFDQLLDKILYEPFHLDDKLVAPDNIRNFIEGHIKKQINHEITSISAYVSESLRILLRFLSLGKKCKYTINEHRFNLLYAISSMDGYYRFKNFTRNQIFSYFKLDSSLVKKLLTDYSYASSIFNQTLDDPYANSYWFDKDQSSVYSMRQRLKTLQLIESFLKSNRIPKEYIVIGYNTLRKIIENGSSSTIKEFDKIFYSTQKITDELLNKIENDGLLLDIVSRNRYTPKRIRVYAALNNS